MNGLIVLVKAICYCCCSCSPSVPDKVGGRQKDHHHHRPASRWRHQEPLQVLREGNHDDDGGDDGNDDSGADDDNDGCYDDGD